MSVECTISDQICLKSRQDHSAHKALLISIKRPPGKNNMMVIEVSRM